MKRAYCYDAAAAGTAAAAAAAVAVAGATAIASTNRCLTLQINMHQQTFAFGKLKFV